MSPEKRIEILEKLATFLDEGNEEFQSTVEEAYQHNKWFTEEHILLSVKNIREQFLAKEKLLKWLSGYDLKRVREPRNVGIIMAGNIPLVGFHDFLCVFLSGHKALVRLSSKDDVLFPFVLKKLFEMEDELREWISVSEIIRGMEAVIATGSNNTSRYFEYYFGKYPNIIRKNRSSVAVLTGKETGGELEKLGFDIFSYFGLGCRNVSKLYVPLNYSFDFFFQNIEPFGSSMHGHNKYKNNYDYNRVLLLMNNTPFLTNDFLIVKEDEKISSPVAMLHYEFYRDEKDLNEKLLKDESQVQCVVGNLVAPNIYQKEKLVPFGQTQSPELWDYADDIDTMKFLVELGG